MFGYRLETIPSDVAETFPIEVTSTDGFDQLKCPLFGTPRKRDAFDLN
jgi:hypothetical protein